MNRSSGLEPVTGVRARAQHLTWSVVASLVVVLTLVVSAPGTSAAPWDLPPGVDLDDLAKKQGYWWDSYESAVRVLSKGKLNRGDVEAAALQLRYAIASEPTSAANQTIRMGGIRQIEYVPYFWLGKALASLGRYSEALECYERENQREIRASNQRGLYEQEIGLLRGLVSLEAFAALSDDVGSWLKSGSDVWISPAGQPTAEKIVQLGNGLRAGGQNTQALIGLQKELAQAVSDLVDTELALRVERIETLLSEDWKSARTQDLGARAESCRRPSGGQGVEELDRSLKTLSQCVAMTDGANQLVGMLACEQLDKLRNRIEERLTFRRRFSEASTAPDERPSRPAECNVAWTQVGPMTLWDAVTQLDFPGRWTTLNRTLNELNVQITENQEGLRTQLTQARAKIPAIPGQCGTDLRIGAAIQELRRLDTLLAEEATSTELFPTPELQNVGADVDAAIVQLASGALRGVTQLDQELVQLRKDFDCQGLEAASYGSLPQLADRFQKSPRPDGMSELCRTARGLRQAMDRCWSVNIEAVRKRVNAYEWILSVAADWSGQSEESCIERASTAIGDLPPANSSRWVERAVSAVGEAQGCLASYHDERARWTGEIENRVRETVIQLGDLSTDQFSGIAELKTSLAGCEETLRSLSPVLSIESDTLSRDALEAGLEQAGIAANVPSGRWNTLGQLSEVDALDARLTIRDEATQADLSRISETLDRAEPLIKRLESLEVLSLAFSAFGRGELDQAIEGLRKPVEWGDGEVTSTARALRHATLSYFLYLKLKTTASMPDTGEVAELLTRDATEQAVMAHRTKPDFDLPESLFDNANFRTFFESCRQEVN